VFESEFNPPKLSTHSHEDKFMNKLNKVVNRYTIQNNNFSDVRFVPTNER